MKNKVAVAQNRIDLYEQARQAISGLTEYPSLILHTTSPILEVGLNNAKARHRAYKNTHSLKSAAYAAQDTARTNAVDFVTKSRDQLVVYLGGDWSERWLPAGFARNLEVGRSVPKLLEQLGALSTYWTTNPAHENAARSLTKAQADSKATMLSGAANDVKTCKADQRRKRDEHTESDETLRELLRDLIKELDVVLEPDDERWMDFGFRIPSDTLIPEAVAEITTDPSRPAHVRASWEETPRADRYLVRIKVVGRDEQFRLAASVREAEVDLNTFRAGEQVQIEVTAANEAGTSAPSPVVQMTVA